MPYPSVRNYKACINQRFRYLFLKVMDPNLIILHLNKCALSIA
jgi:hypothetical protein